MEEYSVVGKRLPLKDAPEKVTGRALFTGDMTLPGMLYARILRSPYAHARVLRVDTSRAERLPGVKAVLSRNNAPRIKVPMTLGMPSDKVAFDDEVRYVGDEVAAVAAVSELIAGEALKLIKVDYEELPAVFDPEEATRPGAPPVHEDKPDNIGILRATESGNVETGFREADYIFEETFRTSSQRHASMETHCALASFDAAGKLTVWTPTQVPYQVQAILAGYLGIPMSRVRVVIPYCGGGFGGKLDMLVEHTAALLSRMAGQPVKLVLGREDEFSATLCRQPFVINLKMGVRRDGTLTAIEAHATSNEGAYMYKGLIIIAIAGNSMTRVYRCPNTKYEGRGVYTNTTPAGAFRGFSSPPAYFAVESMVDMIAEQLGMDPVEFRRKNFRTVGEPSRVGTPITSSGFDECLSRGAELIGWERRGRPGESGGTKKRGMGMSGIAHGSGKRPSESDYSTAFVRINEDGTAHLFIGTADLGTGSNTTLAQIAAEELGLSLDDVGVTAGDTDATPFDEGAMASRTLHVAGGAVRAAAADARHQIFSRAAGKLGVQPEALEVKNKRIFIRDDYGKGLAISELAREARKAKEGAITFLGKASFEDPVSAQTFGAHFAEVEVDTETGRVEVLKLVAVHDVGKAINPLVVEGQIEGGATQGIGYAMMEEPVTSNSTGEMLNSSFSSYLIMTALDMPEIESGFSEPVDPTGPFGAKGVGEPPLEGVAPAIANAIYNATGVRLMEIPITAEKVLKALRDKDIPASR